MEARLKQTSLLLALILQSKQQSWTATCSRLNHSPGARLAINPWVGASCPGPHGAEMTQEWNIFLCIHGELRPASRSPSPRAGTGAASTTHSLACPLWVVFGVPDPAASHKG